MSNELDNEDEIEYKEGDMLEDRYQLIIKLGEGSCATVWKARDNLKRRNIAVKLAKNLNGTILIEIYILRELQRRRIRGVCEIISELYYDCNSPSEPYGFTMKLYNSSIYFKNYSYNKIIDIARQLLMILASIHDIGIIHTDIKPANILLSRGEVILCDFDWGRMVSLKNFKSVTTTIWYRPPEMIYMAIDPNKNKVKKSSSLDVWSLGVTLIELVMYNNLDDDVIYNPFMVVGDDGGFVYDNETHLDMIAELNVNDYVSEPKLVDLISQMLVVDPINRPSCKELLNHSVFDESESSSSIDSDYLDSDYLDLELVYNKTDLI